MSYEKAGSIFMFVSAPRLWASAKSRDEGLRLGLVNMASRNHVRGAAA